MKNETIRLFHKLFNAEPEIVVKGPGRINLIGEHTDYNNGFVLPAAINKAVYIALSKRNDRKVYLFSEEYNNQIVAQIDMLKPSRGWSSYILGVVDQYKKNGFSIEGFNIVINSNLPIGAGISSSAAIECAVAFALNKLFDFQLSKKKLALLAQKAEHEFAGVNCGIMDQFASLFGKKNHVIKLDCRSLDYTYYPLSMNNYKIVLLDTGVKHSLASSEYNKRRQECEEGVQIISQKYTSIQSLRDTNLMQVEECLMEYPTVYKRCKYVVEENERLTTACEYLNTDNLVEFGKAMNQTHVGLSELYEVSCAELDFLVNKAQLIEGVLGSRMMGGGFGGCTINLVENHAVDTLIKGCTQDYKTAMDMRLIAHIVEIEDGTSQLAIQD